MLINGKQIAEDMLQVLALERDSYENVRLGILLSHGNKATDSFIRIKERVAKRLNVELLRKEIYEDDTTHSAVDALQELMEKTDGVIVQLPFFPHIDLEEVLANLNPLYDVDALGKEPIVFTPVVAAIDEICKRYSIDLSNKRLLVAGHGRLVGRPITEWLTKQGLMFQTVTNPEDLALKAQEADVIFLGTGAPHLLKPSMIKEGVIIMDAGTSESE